MLHVASTSEINVRLVEVNVLNRLSMIFPLSYWIQLQRELLTKYWYMRFRMQTLPATYYLICKLIGTCIYANRTELIEQCIFKWWVATDTISLGQYVTMFFGLGTDIELQIDYLWLLVRNYWNFANRVNCTKLMISIKCHPSITVKHEH